MERRRSRDGWAAWVLVLAAALPTAMTIGLGWLAFSGYWGSPPARSRATTGRELLAYRWSDFWFNTPATTLLLTSLLPLLVLAGAALLDRPYFLVPTGASRKAAMIIGVVATCLGLIEIVGFLGQLTGLLPVQTWGAFTSSQLIAFAPVAVEAFIYLVLSAVVTTVLWRRGDEEPAEGPPTGSAVEAAVVEEAIAADAAQPTLASEAVWVDTEPSQPKLLEPGAPSAMPTPSASDLDRYRR